MARNPIAICILLGAFTAAAAQVRPVQGTAGIFGRVHYCSSLQGIDIYIYSDTSPVAKLLRKMENTKETGHGSSLQALLDQYSQLLTLVKRTPPQAHTVTDSQGNFRFEKLPSRRSVVLLGVVDRKDEPTHYGYKITEELVPYNYNINLDLADGEPCPK